MKTYGIPETQTLVSIPLDENGDPRLDTLAPNPKPEDWTPPVIIPLVKIPKPEDDGINVYSPKLVWFADRVERQWEGTPLSEAQINNANDAEVIRVAKLAAKAKKEFLEAPYLVQPENFYLATTESDQNAFTRLVTLLQLASPPAEHEVAIADKNGAIYSVSVSRFLEIMVGYGVELSTRWTQSKTM